MLNRNITLKQLEIVKNSEQFVVVYRDKIFYVGDLMGLILIDLKNGLCLEEICKKNNQVDSCPFIKVEINNFLDNIGNSSKSKQNNYIYFKVPLLKQKVVVFLSRFFIPLFKSRTIAYMSVISIACNLLYLFNSQVLPDVKLNSTTALYYYIILLICFVIHELGHTAASISFNVTPKEIGFGIYIIFPVLYADVTRVWILDKSKKIIVNYAGIYLQLILNCVLIVVQMACSNTYANLFNGIIKANISVIIFSLFPFIKNDGYWIISDYFGLNNLLSKAKRVPVYLWLNKKIDFSPKSNIVIILFSLCYYIFRFYVIYITAKLFTRVLFSMPNETIDFGFILKLSLSGLGLFFSVYSTYKLIELLVGEYKNNATLKNV
ncbi:hypothetical protein DF185_11975 [Marinifilum breve]|uniref:Peptidase M50 domain-containing protein n=1 Tax=Marinifilum breve TaxID=2184082 RepID=A0A2V4A9H9_9BACT|nr:hypothetical protein [Marinifilum breve]PXY00624.1 hypothetical protein DF185_11975 [Marinifilum breve]